MKKILLILFSTFIFCACEKSDVEQVKPDLTDFEQFSSDELAMFRANDESGLIKKPAGPFPFWARVSNDMPQGMPFTDDYGIIYFYVQNTDDVTSNFNLLNFMDFTALGADIAVEGSSWMKQPVLSPFQYPYMVKLKGLGAVHVWIITIDQVEQVNLDGIITMEELNSLDPLPSKGIATDFLENLWPYGDGGAPNPGIIVKANGIIVEGYGDIETGQRFTFHFKTKITVDAQLIIMSTQLKLF